MGAARIPDLPLRPEGHAGRPLPAPAAPRRIVVIRLQAFGDCAATLPVLAALKDRWPGCRLDVVTGPQTAALFEARRGIDGVHRFDARTRRVARVARVVRLAAALGGADAILDLQRSRWSLLLTRLARPRAWVAFDRFAPRTGLTRYLGAAEWVGLGKLQPVFEPRLVTETADRADELLRTAGRDPRRPLVCLNPAGGWVTKQWPLDRYVALGRRLEKELGAQLLALGAGEMSSRVGELKGALGDSLIDFSGRTTPDVAMGLVSRAALIVSDDSGLMHLAWAQGVPALALFGASRAVWSRADGPGCSGFYSEDLACGACMQPVCTREDLLCLARVSVEKVFDEAARMLPGERA